MSEDREARVRARAYQRWENEGRPHGRETQHWLDAESDVTAEETADTDQQGISNHPTAEESEEQRQLPPRSRRKVDFTRHGPEAADKRGDETPRH